MASFEPILSDLQIGKLTVHGRVYKTATAETRADEDGYVTDELCEFYEPMAEAGTPLIITGNIYINAEGKSTHRMTGADADDKIPGLRRLADTVHAGGSKLFAQLNHCGRQVLADAMGLDSAVSASDVREQMLRTKPRPMTVEVRGTWGSDEEVPPWELREPRAGYLILEYANPSVVPDEQGMLNAILIEEGVSDIAQLPDEEAEAILEEIYEQTRGGEYTYEGYFTGEVRFTVGQESVAASPVFMVTSEVVDD